MNKEQELKKQIEELKKTEKEFETSIEFDNTFPHCCYATTSLNRRYYVQFSNIPLRQGETKQWL